MKKKTAGIIYGILLFGIMATVVNAQVSTPNFFKKVGNAILMLQTPWELGSSSVRVAKGWFTNLDSTSATIGTLQISSKIDPGPLVVTASTNPTIRFTGDTDSGLSWISDNKIGLMTNNTNVLTVNGGNVGIGNTTPGFPLDVVGAGKLSTGLITPKIYPASDSTTAVQINKADGTTNVLNVDTTNGRVGIGTTNPLGKLYIEGENMYLFNPTGDAAFYIGTDAGSNNYASMHWSIADNRLAIGTQSSLDALNIKNGNVGIGTTSPGALLDVNGTTMSGGGSAGKAMCWKADGKTLGYCSSVVDITGGCTCN